MEHKTPVLGDFNTIAGRFARGGTTNLDRKKYSKSIFSLATKKTSSAPMISFSNADFEGVAPP